MRLERACARALRFDTATYRSIKQILQKGLETEVPLVGPSPNSAPPVFARTAQQLLVGGA